MPKLFRSVCPSMVELTKFRLIVILSFQEE